MKSYSQNNSNNETKKQNLWEAFVSHLESTYFPGASETLESQLIAFEYEQFCSCYN